VSELPELRASDADRERAADTLRRAAGVGRLTMDELDERLNAAYAARTRAELERLTADVVAEDDEAPAHRMPVRPGEGGARWLVAIMGGCDRAGRWRLSERATCVNVMGGSDLDLNDAELAGEHVELTVFSLMGGADIRVPEGLNVEVSDFALLGGNDVDIGDQRPDPGGPVLHLRLISIMGGTDVKRGRRKSRAEKRAARERRKHLPHG
jgi:Domain of unknown function (DUF1707)